MDAIVSRRAMKISKEEAASLRDEIAACFAGVAKPNVKLIDGAIRSNWGKTPTVWPNENWDSWTEITPEVLRIGARFFSFFTEDELAYFVPAYLMQLVSEMEDGCGNFSSA